MLGAHRFETIKASETHTHTPLAELRYPLLCMPAVPVIPPSGSYLCKVNGSFFCPHGQAWLVARTLTWSITELPWIQVGGSGQGMCQVIPLVAAITIPSVSLDPSLKGPVWLVFLVRETKTNSIRKLGRKGTRISPCRLGWTCLPRAKTDPFVSFLKKNSFSRPCQTPARKARFWLLGSATQW